MRYFDLKILYFSITGLLWSLKHYETLFKGVCMETKTKMWIIYFSDFIKLYKIPSINPPACGLTTMTISAVNSLLHLHLNFKNELKQEQELCGTNFL